MRTCKTCKYWHKDYKIENNISDCDRWKCLPNLSNDVMFTVIADASDDQGLTATIMTGKDFSCIHHTSKSEKNY